ncbi:hypothetical protein ACOJR9_14195 [Alteromonas sp. A081]|uniref:hypothetical protein n=1 Tax=Alteromonas sp. A081 TaxID=3410269 RepID=UPI003B984925
MKELTKKEVVSVCGGNSNSVSAAYGGIGGFGTGAGIGAAVGSIGGPPGALIGGLIGGMLGTIGGTFAAFAAGG